MGDDLRLAVAVAAFEGVDGAESLLEAGEGRRIVLDAVRQAADLGRDVLELRLEAGETLGQRLEPWVEAGQATRFADGHRGGIARAGAVGGECLADRGRSPGDRLAMLGGRQPSPDLVGLAGPEPGRGDLLRFVLEEVHPPRQLARVDRQLRQRGPVRAPALDHVGRRGTSRGMPAVRVEQVALPALVEQALLVVLAVDLDQRPDLVGEPGGGRGDVVEPGGRPAVGRDLANGDQRLRKAVEQRLDPRRLGAVADEARVRARSPHEPEGIDQQALARAGLAGDDVQPRPEGQAQPVDQRQVADGQLEEAARAHEALTRAATPPCGEAGPRTVARPPGR